ncbi:hypothetical protein GQ55_5G344300 [Panicum hallii var. hallii]|uniref:Uncharacterized protein n=1 Tax=Panicum hallii var. hallii TaxID=1504633 RepID=A0A2T7DM58_9POAL|nr:hypothetical protein GQ55_5G344300 [Panicum hallii var. hallii]
MPSSAAARALLLLFFLLVLQIPSLLGSRSSAQHAAVADPAATAVGGGRRLLPVPAVHEQSSVEERVATHPRSLERRARRSGSGSAFVDAVSKHQVPSGANPDSN